MYLTYYFLAYSPLNDHVSQLIDREKRIVGAVNYGPPVDLKSPQLIHQVGAQKVQPEGILAHFYPSAKSAGFVIPAHEDFHPSSASISHTRSLTFLKQHMGSPIFDLEAIWDEHTAFEFGNRSVENTMGTMVQEPYVNHIPTASIYGLFYVNCLYLNR